jgi:hypothetical protein
MNLDDIEALISKHGSITAQPLKDLVVTVVLEAIEAEREACAAMVERGMGDWRLGKKVSAAIRARSNV